MKAKTFYQILKLIFAFTFLGCQSLAEHQPGSPFSETRNERKVVSPIFLSQLTAGLNTGEDLFNSNLFCGEITFSGGIITDRNYGNMRRAKTRQFDRVNDFITTGRDVIGQAFQKAFGLEPEPSEIQHGLPFDFLVLSSQKTIPEKSNGTDNINYPLLEWTVKLNPKSDAPLPPSRIILQPIIECWYLHNAGWFNDQYGGCGAGIRLRGQVLVIDSPSKTLLQTLKFDFFETKDATSFLSINDFEMIQQKLISRLAQHLKNNLKS